MARSSVFIAPARFRGVRGLARTMELIAALPDCVVAEVKPGLDAGADLLVNQIQAIAPVSELTKNPGDLRDSVHREDGPHDLSVLVVEDAVDENGKPIPAHVEYGHKAKDGSQVPAVPHFWPAYRVTKKPLRSRVSRAVTKGVKAAKALHKPDGAS